MVVATVENFRQGVSERKKKFEEKLYGFLKNVCEKFLILKKNVGRKNFSFQLEKKCLVRIENRLKKWKKCSWKKSDSKSFYRMQKNEMQKLTNLDIV